ncbi:MAG TPA: translation elongation factor Ts [Acidimicrobiales bacterium]|jgi:elongation factor Ts
MSGFSAADVKKLRDATGVGMMDAKRALTENGGDFDAAGKWLLEAGLAKSAERSDRENSEGLIALGRAGRAASLVQLKSETDFVAKSPDFVALAQGMADAVAADGPDAIAGFQDRLDELKVSLKENIDVGKVVRIDPAPGSGFDAYLHVQNGRGVNGVLVELEGADDAVAHEVALHISFSRPSVLSRDEVPADAVAQQREILENQTRNEGKPEQALPKIVEGKLGGWFKRVGSKGIPGGVLLEQPWVHDEKQTVAAALGSARVVAFAQAEIG